MNAKHLYDSADGLVLKSLRGAVALNPGIILYVHPIPTLHILSSYSIPFDKEPSADSPSSHLSFYPVTNTRR